MLADHDDNPVPKMPATNCTAQLGVPGPWHERLPHFRHDATPSAGEEIQTEFLLPRVHAADALRAMRRIGHLISPVLQISEIRTVAADHLWLSPSYEQDSVAIHFTFVRDPIAIAPVVRAIEAELEPYSPRPHWGKVFSMDPAVVRSRYPRFGDFRRLAADWDPNGVFHNAFLEPYLRCHDTERLRCAVVGAGAWGLPTATELARRGHDVTLIDRYGVGNPLSSSPGPSRLWRLTHPDAVRVRLAQRSVEAWERLSRDSWGDRLPSTRTPVARRRVAALPSSRPSPRSASSTRVVDGPDVSRYFPGLRPDGRDAVWQQDAGPVLASVALSAQERLFARPAGCSRSGRSSVTSNPTARRRTSARRHRRPVGRRRSGARGRAGAPSRC